MPHHRNASDPLPDAPDDAEVADTEVVDIGVVDTEVADPEMPDNTETDA